jgi:hypothetical protein
LRNAATVEVVRVAKLTKLTAKTRAKFVEILRKTGNVTLAARAIKTSRTAVYEWRAQLAAFAQAWDEAQAEYDDFLECEADRRATKGVRKPVYWRGQRVGHVREYSDALLMFRLRARRPDVYRERTDTTHTFTGPLVVEQTQYGDENPDPV